MISSAWANVSDARSVEQMKREDGFADVQRIDCYTLAAAESLIRERVAGEVEDVLFSAFEAGWFDNTGDIGEAWSERKADLLDLVAARVRKGGSR